MPEYGTGDHAEASPSAVATAMWASLATSRVATDLAARGIPVLLLKGPPVQQRLLGTESAYESADVDLLVPRRQGRQARRSLVAAGWKVLPDNGLLWRLDRAIALEGDRVVVDLHWGVHLGPVPPWTLAPLERALWSKASRTDGGWWQPRPEPLVVYLALHASAFGYSKPAGLSLVGAAADLVAGWGEVRSLSEAIGAWPAVEHAVARARGTAEGDGPSLLAGPKGRLLMASLRLARTGLVPERARRTARTARDRLRR